MTEVTETRKDIRLYLELVKDVDSKSHPEYFFHVLSFAEPENKELLSRKNIVLKKPSQWIVLAIEHQILKKVVSQAEALGFLDAYQQNPAFLRQDVEKVIKRMAQLEHLGIPYKNEKGKYTSVLFSERAFNYTIAQNSKGDTLQGNDATPSVIDLNLKDYADRVMETFGLTSEAPQVYANISKIQNSGLGVKEILIEVFKTYSDNVDYLSSMIDEILNANKEVGLGMTA